MKKKFENIKGMLKQEEMKMVIGGNAYESATKGGAPASSFASGTALSGALNSSNGLTISYGNNGVNYSTSYNYGAGMNGSAASGYPANTYTNGGSTSAPTRPKPYGQP